MKLRQMSRIYYRNKNYNYAPYLIAKVSIQWVMTIIILLATIWYHGSNIFKASLAFYPSLSIAMKNVTLTVCGMIKRKESHVEEFQFYILTLLSCNLKMLHVDANPTGIEYLVSEFWEMVQFSKKCKTKLFRLWIYLAISKKQYLWHPPFSPWSCHIYAYFKTSWWRCVQQTL